MGGTTFYSFRDTLSTHTRAHTYIRIRNWPLNPCGIRASLLSVTFQSRWSFFFSFFTRAHVFVSPASRYILSRTNLCLTRALSKQLPALFYIFIAYTGTCAERNSQLRNLTTWFAYASIFFSSVTPPFPCYLLSNKYLFSHPVPLSKNFFHFDRNLFCLFFKKKIRCINDTI